MCLITNKSCVVGPDSAYTTPWRIGSDVESSRLSHGVRPCATTMYKNNARTNHEIDCWFDNMRSSELYTSPTRHWGDIYAVTALSSNELSFSGYIAWTWESRIRRRRMPMRAEKLLDGRGMRKYISEPDIAITRRCSLISWLPKRMGWVAWEGLTRMCCGDDGLSPSGMCQRRRDQRDD